MNRTRLSLLYVAGYLLSGGAGLLFAPSLALKLMFSNGQYEEVLVRLAGVLTIGLGALVLQIIRLKIDALYFTTLGVRALFLLCYGWLYCG